MSQQYKQPPVDPSSPAGEATAGQSHFTDGTQIRTDYYDRKALYETRKERYFSQMADVTSMPKHYGKKIVKYHMMPMLDDRNTSDQGINAAGVVMDDTSLWSAFDSAGVEVENGSPNAFYATQALALTAAGAGGVAVQNKGNLYGSSKDIGAITGKLPVIGENGGRVNRVGFTRLQIEGTMENYGLFTEFTEDLLNFDSMSDLYEHISRELITGAVQMTEAMIQMDVIDAAGVIRLGGIAADKAELTGEGADISIVDYEDLQRLSITLDDNRTPKHVKMIRGSNMTDTVTVDNGRFLYAGSEMIPTLTKMTDHFGNPAFVSVEHYGYAGSYKEGTNMIHGEIGKIGQFRIIIVPEMLHDAGAGAVATDGDSSIYRATLQDGGVYNYDAFPLVCIGSESFTTIGFQTGGGANFKFKIITRMPGEIVTLDDPYAKTGFSSLQFWYGFMPLRPERLATFWSVAER